MLKGKIRDSKKLPRRSVNRKKHKRGSKFDRKTRALLRQKSESGEAKQSAKQHDLLTPEGSTKKVHVKDQPLTSMVSVRHAFDSARTLKHSRLRGRVEVLEEAEELLLQRSSIKGWPKRGTYAWKVVYEGLPPGHEPTLRNVKDKLHLARQDLEAFSKWK
jgi:hypothetical protein